MNRTITRLFGFCVAFVSTGVGINTAMATQPKDPNCTSGTLDVLLGTVYNEWICVDGRTGWLASNIDRANIIHSECTGDTLEQFTGCSDGWCNVTGIYCADRNSFSSWGCLPGEPGDIYCNYRSGGINVPTAENGYYFSHCATGFYQNPGVSGSALVPFVTNLSGIVYNCSPCSGLRFSNGKLETYYPPDGYTGNANDFYWMPWGAGMNIESCRAYTTGIMKNIAGTFALSSDGCPYVN